MHGVSPVADASAELAMGKPDENGNTALEMEVKRLPQLPQGGWYELYLSKNGVIGASCGTFVTPETTRPCVSAWATTSAPGATRTALTAGS